MLKVTRAAREFRSIVKSRFGLAAVGATAAIAMMLPATTSSATPYFAQKTGQHCDYCHIGAPDSNGANELNSTGLAFKANGYSFPTQPSYAPMPPAYQQQQPQQQPCRTMELYDANGRDRGAFRVCN
jgi:hypothetical protein